MKKKSKKRKKVYDRNSVLIDECLREPSIQDVSASLSDYSETPLEADALVVLEKWLTTQHGIRFQYSRRGPRPSAKNLHLAKIARLIRFGQMSEMDACKLVKDRFKLPDDIENLRRAYARFSDSLPERAKTSMFKIQNLIRGRLKAEKQGKTVPLLVEDKKWKRFLAWMKKHYANQKPKRTGRKPPHPS